MRRRHRVTVAFRGLGFQFRQIPINLGQQMPGPSERAEETPVRSHPRSRARPWSDASLAGRKAKAAACDRRGSGRRRIRCEARSADTRISAAVTVSLIDQPFEHFAPDRRLRGDVRGGRLQFNLRQTMAKASDDGKAQPPRSGLVAMMAFGELREENEHDQTFACRL